MDFGNIKNYVIAGVIGIASIVGGYFAYERLSNSGTFAASKAAPPALLADKKIGSVDSARIKDFESLSKKVCDAFAGPDNVVGSDDDLLSSRYSNFADGGLGQLERAEKLLDNYLVVTREMIKSLDADTAELLENNTATSLDLAAVRKVNANLEDGPYVMQLVFGASDRARKLSA